MGLWLVLVRALPGLFADEALTRLQTLTLSAALGWVFVSGILGVASPRLSPPERVAILWLLRTLLVLPLAFLAVSATQDVLLPAPVRADGELPNVPALLGQNERVVERLLGTTDRRGDKDPAPRRVVIAASAVSDARPVVYTLPDLKAPQGRDARDAGEGGPLQLLQQLKTTPDRTGRDVRVIVYFSAEGKAIAAHLELGRAWAGALLGPDWFERLPARSGLDGGLTPAEAPRWAEVEYGSRGAGHDKWGFARVEGRAVAYHLSAFQTTPSAGGRADDGLVSLTVGAGLLDPPPPLTATPVIDSSEDTSSEDGGSGRRPSRGATADFYERAFFVVVLDETKTEAAAWRRVDTLNERASASGETSPAVTVERSGHLLQGDDDSWLVVHTIGFESTRDASRRARALSWDLRVMARVTKAWKRCGEFTFIDVKADSTGDGKR